ncbi:MAG: hypothetical protein IJH52_03905 [Oscillospiraceae bacterium]|nr:hypothetical protein [Oscillospiraceae bacterium]
MENNLHLHGLTLPIPAGFHVMDKEEWSRMKLLADGEGTGLSDPGRHMVVTLGWKQAGGFSAALLSAKDLAKNMEKQICRAMASLGCRSEGVKTRAIGGREAHGARYRYTAQGTDMTGESWVVKEKKEIWYLHGYMRTELLEVSLPVWEEMLDSITIEPSH